MSGDRWNNRMKSPTDLVEDREVAEDEVGEEVLAGVVDVEEDSVAEVVNVTCSGKVVGGRCRRRSVDSRSA